MAQKFLSLEEAADQLGISKDRLKALRDANKVTGYKDGQSWKFRSEVIEKLAAEGIPSIEASPSDLALNLDDDLDLDGGSLDESAAPTPAPSKPATLPPTFDDLDLDLAHEEPAAKPPTAMPAGSDLSLDDEEMMIGPASDLSLDDVDEPTVAGLDEGSDDALALDDNDSIDLTTDSILLSETELGGSPGRPPSTIIGKSELDLDADLDLSPLDKGGGPASDVKLVSDSGVLPAGDDDLGLLDLPSPSGDFENLEELEVDLEAESSRILSQDDVAKAQAAAKKAAASKAAASSGGLAGFSDLELAPTASDPGIATSDIGIGKEGSSNLSLAGLSALELDDDDDQVLGDGSDVTLSGESSGINIISPSDSGLALDEVPLDLSGSAPIGSSLDLGSSVSEEEVSLEPLSMVGAPDSKVGDFQLTPLGEDDGEEEKDSSQVIALDELSEETAGSPGSVGLGDAGMLTDDFGAGLAPGAAPVGMVAPADATPFSVWNVLALASCVLMISICGMMTYDLLRNIWSWEGVGKINSTLLDGLSSLLGK